MLLDKDIIWMAGGACGYLMYWIRRTGLDKHLPELLKDNKRIYVGSSAGSMITAPTLDICEWYIGENEVGASSIPSLGLVDFDFYPHYEDNLYDEIVKHYHGNTMYLLKNGEVMIVENGDIKISGEERIVRK
jgi:peptidase E